MKPRAHVLPLLFASSLALGGRAAAQCVRYSVVEIQATSGATTYAQDVNEAGQVAFIGDGASIWSGGTIQTLGVLPGGFFSTARAINDAGHVVGSSQTTPDNNSRHAILWNGALVDLGTLGGAWSDANGINSFGEVCGRGATAINPWYHACVWSGGGVLDLVVAAGLPNSSNTNTEAYDINDSFQVVGSGFNGHAFLWENNVMFDLGTLGGNTSQAFAINEAGLIVGESALPGTSGMAFLYAGGVMYGLGLLPGGSRTRAEDINNLGTIVGFGLVPGAQAAVRWSPTGGLQNLNDLIDPASGWQLQSAEAVNDAGWIVGWGLKNGPPTRGFLLVPTVESTPVTLEVLDPNPDLLVGGAVVEDVPTLSAYAGPGALGLAADGVTQLLLRVRGLPGPGDVLFSLRDAIGLQTPGNGTLSTLDGGVSGDFVTIAAELLPDMTYGAFALLEAPGDFARDALDASQTTRELRVGAEYGATGAEPPGCATVTLELDRAPVVLLHGLWSSAATWDYALQGDARFEIWEQDYSATHAAPFATNAGQIRAGVASAVQALRDRGIAATQADVIGHSMGGLLARRHVSGVGSMPLRNDNFLQGDVRRLVTVDTPHHGSPLATILVDAGGQSTLIGRAFNAAGMCTDCGAVYDLRPDSTAIATLPAASLPVHAMVGKGGSDILQAGLESLLPARMGVVLSILQFFGVLEDVFPVALQHDLIVGRLSQEGGLGTGATQTSVVGFQAGLSIGVHTTVTNETVASVRALELIEADAGDPVLFAGGFSGGSGFVGPPLPPPPALGECTSCLAVTSPAPGAHVQAGAQLAVSVAPVGGFVPARVLVAVDGAIAVDDQAPFDLVLDVPVDAIGPLQLVAFAIDASDVVAQATAVPLVVDVPATLLSLEVTPDPVYLFEFAPEQQLVVRGVYDDGATRDLSDPTLGTIYAVGDDCYATVDAAGLVTGRSTGTTTVLVTHGAQAAEIAVRVVGVPPGSSAPSFCDAADGSLAACPCGNAGLPETGCDVQQGTGGVGLCLLAQETAPQNRVTWSATGFPAATTPTSIVLRAASLDAARPVVFGDGLRCVGVPLVRLAATFAAGGAATHVHGHGTTAGSGDFYYQLWFRNTPIMYCDPAAAFNLSNGRRLAW